MKKVFGFSILLLIIVALNSCSTNGSANSNNSNSNGKLSKIHVQSTSENYYLNFFYDNNGRFIRYCTGNEGGTLIVESWTYTRNADGIIIGQTFNNTSANYSEYTSYNLNANGQYLSSIKTPSEPNANRDSVVYYYTGNKIIQTDTYSSYRFGPFNFSGKERYTYDNSGNRIKIETFNSSTNQWDLYKSYTYDSNLPALDLNSDIILIGAQNNGLIETSSFYTFTYNYTYGSNNRPATASVIRTYTSGPTQTENWTYYY